MKEKFKGWGAVSRKLAEYADENSGWLNEGQRASLHVIADRIPKNGLVLADEVGMGKTRIAVALARSVIDSGGRVAILLPSGLGFQWLDELRHGGISNTPPVLRSLWAYFAAWDSDQGVAREPWFTHALVLVSHAFTNWRLGANSDSWRWALLPTVYAEWRKKSTGRYPRDHYESENLRDQRVCAAARSICHNIPDDVHHGAHRRVQELSEKTPWPGALEASEYGRNEYLRPWLGCAVGLGLGVFDLVIIDEAHKSRGAESGLSRLLDHVVLQSALARRFAVTATPVELDVAQWQQTLERIGVGAAALTDIRSRIDEYAVAVRRVRQCWRSSQEGRDEYRRAALGFQRALSPYLLRRDKREDDVVRKFQSYTAKGVESYRCEKEVSVRMEDLSPAWRRAVCAAESLSLVTHQADDPLAKRLRLTMASGHAIASLIDQIQRDEHEDKNQQEYEKCYDDGLQENDESGAEEEAHGDDGKRRLRVQWWRESIENVFTSERNALFEHPAVLAAVSAIEEHTRRQEKVLVFGRFTRPLRALADLLNAREMLRSLQENRRWPQSKVHSSGEYDDWPAVKAARRQLNCTLRLEEIDRILVSQYAALERRRERLRDHLFNWIGEGLSDHEAYARALLGSAQMSPNDETRTLLARALDELLESENEPEPLRCAQAFTDLITALADRDEADSNGDGELDESEAGARWSELENRLREEYFGPQRGTFARLMYGETKLTTRRTLQLAFNRPGSFPRVLVAQSLVGREGLNLHQACRVVVLLHPEWNPGAVEQQIGRVDRVGSHWSRQLEKAIRASVLQRDLPRIEICPIIFRGTYDEYHWKVLNERWDDLRAQLHGIVVPQRLRSGANTEEWELIKQLDEAGPNFSPLHRIASARSGKVADF